jgi:hypothetical protein
MPTAIGQRRSERLFLDVPLSITGESNDQGTFEEDVHAERECSRCTGTKTCTNESEELG